MIFGWLMNRIQVRESAKRVVESSSRELREAVAKNSTAGANLHNQIVARRTASQQLQATLVETLARVRRH